MSLAILVSLFYIKVSPNMGKAYKIVLVLVFDVL